MIVIWSLQLLLLLRFADVVYGQLSFSNNGDGTATITTCNRYYSGAVTIPDTTNGLLVTSVGDNACNDCTGLTSVTIGNNVTNIGIFAFNYCVNLTNATVGNHVSSIGQCAFEYCQSLASITIPSSVTSVGLDAFAACFQLKGIYFQGNAPVLGYNVFGSDDFATVYYLPWTGGWASANPGVPMLLWDSQPLLQNGGFETGDFTGWTFLGNTIVSGYIYDAVESSSSTFPVTHSGRYGILLGDNQLASLSQALTTIPGQYYILSLWLENMSSGMTQIFKVSWNTNSVTTNTICSIVNPPAFSWTNLQFLVTTTSTNTTLLIQAENDPSAFGLDEISLTPIPKPTLQASVIPPNGFQLSWVTAPGMQTNPFGFDITGSSNLVILVDTCTNIAYPAWTPIGNNLGNSFISSNGTYYFKDLDWTNYQSKFYRFHSP